MIPKLTLQKARLIIAIMLTLNAVLLLLTAALNVSVGHPSWILWTFWLSAAWVTFCAAAIWTLYLRGQKNTQPSGTI